MEINIRNRHNKFAPVLGFLVMVFGIIWHLGSIYLVFFGEFENDRVAELLMIVFGPMFLVAGFFLYKDSSKDTRQLKQVIASGGKCFGEVRQVFTYDKSYPVYEGESMTNMVYSFSVGRKKFRTQIGVYKKDGLNVGDKIEVIYDSRNPERNYWVGEF